VTDTASVLIVEDDPRLRSVLRSLIAEDARIDVVQEVATAGQAVAYVLAHEVDLVVLDHHLDDGAAGVEAAETLRSARPATRIIVCTADLDVHDADPTPAVDAWVSKQQLIHLLGSVQRLLHLDSEAPTLRP
jgi:DNA-binding NarL/FixJ family response regulator